ncbi:hypothetical protein Pelo_7408 [Pelomyxa schiedti]|nr:hypothetical protein Pelo_7408 [Pelomyxa schiedti]
MTACVAHPLIDSSPTSTHSLPQSQQAASVSGCQDRKWKWNDFKSPRSSLSSSAPTILKAASGDCRNKSPQAQQQPQHIQSPTAPTHGIYSHVINHSSLTNTTNGSSSSPDQAPGSPVLPCSTPADMPYLSLSSQLKVERIPCGADSSRTENRTQGKGRSRKVRQRRKQGLKCTLAGLGFKQTRMATVCPHQVPPLQDDDSCCAQSPEPKARRLLTPGSQAFRLGHCTSTAESEDFASGKSGVGQPLCKICKHTSSSYFVPTYDQALFTLSVQSEEPTDGKVPYLKLKNGFLVVREVEPGEHVPHDIMLANETKVNGENRTTGALKIRLYERPSPQENFARTETIFELEPVYKSRIPPAVTEEPPLRSPVTPDPRTPQRPSFNCPPPLPDTPSLNPSTTSPPETPSLIPMSPPNQPSTCPPFHLIYKYDSIADSEYRGSYNLNTDQSESDTAGTCSQPEPEFNLFPFLQKKEKLHNNGVEECLCASCCSNKTAYSLLDDLWYQHTHPEPSVSGSNLTVILGCTPQPNLARLQSLSPIEDLEMLHFIDSL